MSANISRHSLRDAVLLSAVPQVVLFLYACFMTILAEKNLFLCVVMAIALNLAVTMFVGLRRTGMPTVGDLRIIRWGFLPLLLLTLAVCFLCSGLMN